MKKLLHFYKIYNKFCKKLLILHRNKDTCDGIVKDL